MKNINELKKGVKELVIALLKCKPTKDKEIIDFNVRAFMGGFEDYLSNQSVSDEEIDKEAIRFCKEHYPEYDDITKEIEVFDHAIFWMRDTPTAKKECPFCDSKNIKIFQYECLDCLCEFCCPKEQGETKEIKFCINCGCGKPKKTYDGYWCKMCKTEL